MNDRARPTPRRCQGIGPEAHAACVVNGWTLFAHPLLLEQIQSLAKQVEALRSKDPQGYLSKNLTKRL
jgi:toxin YhaV